MRHLWWIPLLFALVVGSVGAYAYRTLAEATRANLRDELETILNADVAALELWVAHRETTARAAALEPVVRESVAELVAIDRATPDAPLRDALIAAPAMERLRSKLSMTLEMNGYLEFGVVRRDGLLLATSRDELVASRIRVEFEAMEKRWAGETSISPPARDDATGTIVNALRVGTPVRGADDAVIASLGFQIPLADFARVLRIARTGESGETYAFDRNGLLVSPSRFDDQLVAIGLLEAGQSSAMKIQVRDPGGDLTQGFEPGAPVAGRPLTRMAAAAVTEGAGFDIDGYRDYRGVPVVGAWTWLPELGIGIATELDYDEAYAGLTTVRRAFALLAALLLLAALGMLAYSWVIARLERRYESARKLGRYRIVEKIGEGGMGKVYRANHALLRRPTAVKLLDSENATSEAVKRFEREVQSVAGLTHPNTIAVYDYGRTPDGAFYYAMELLDGVTIGQLVALSGAQPEARVRNILLQAAGSLAEAHAAKFVHRDLKPSNLMLCMRGGLFDFVKVLDFGLVRGAQEEVELTRVESLTGTPLYLAPEALESPEKVGPYSDVYQLGAIAYFLLTGDHVFRGELVEVLSAHLHETPRAPSAVRGEDSTTELDALVMACLAKKPGDRPADASVLLNALEHCRVEGTWTQANAREWWETTAGQRAPNASDGPDTASTVPSGWQVDPDNRSRAS